MAVRSAVPVHRGARRHVRVVLAVLALLTVTTVSPSPADPASALTSVSDTGGDAVMTDSLTPVTDAVGTGPVDVDAREVTLGDDGAARVPVAEAGSVHAVAVDPGVRMFGVSWSGSPAASVEVRTRTDGRWGAWQLHEADAADGEDVPSGRFGGSPVFIGESAVDRLDVRVGDHHLADLEVLLISWEDNPETHRAAASRRVASPAVAPRPTIRLRSAWTNSQGCEAPTYMRTIRHVVVHHTVSTNSYTPAQVPGLIAGIHRYHTQSMGWCDIAYNFIVDKYGVIWQGRAGDVHRHIRGGHARGFNTESLGVTLLGQYHPGAQPAAARPSSAQIASVTNVIAWKLSQAGRDPTGRVTVTSQGSTRYASGTPVTLNVVNGHRDHSSTVCPGTYVMNHMAAIRRNAKARIDAAPRPVPRYGPYATAKDFIDRQAWDFLGAPANNFELWLGTAALHQGLSVGDYTAGVSRSHAVRTQLDPIPRLFRAGFGRDPSTASMVLWRNRFRSGQRPIHLAQAIIANPEGVRRYGHLANRPFVEQLYRDVLGRPGAPNWVDRHTASLNDRSRSRGDLLLEFAETKENRDRQEARVSTIVTYFAMLGRVPTDSLPRWQAEPLPVLAAAIIASPEWRSRPR